MKDDESARDRTSSMKAFMIMKAIEANGKKDGDYWAYNDGWDDARIAAECEASEQAVAYRRKEVFGQIRRGYSGRDSDLHVLHTEIESIKTQLKALRVEDFDQKKRIEALEKVVNILMSGQNVDRVTSDKLRELKNHFSGYAKPTPGM